MIYDVLIIGGGPAGLTAATYACRAGKSVLVLEKNTFGGQITWSPKVENYPSIRSISGLELGDRMLDQAMSLGADAELDEVTTLESKNDIWIARCASGIEFASRTVILAVGAKPRLLGLDQEERYIGNGISFCAVCDGAFFEGKTAVVAGGGNSALQDALILSDLCTKVYLVHRRDSFRAEKLLSDMIASKSNIEVLLNTEICGFIGEESLTGLILRDSTGTRTLSTDVLFEAIGHCPDTAMFHAQLSLDAAGYICADETCRLPSSGLFIAGDCRTKSVRQLTTAVADGAVAALAACEWLDRRV